MTWEVDWTHEGNAGHKVWARNPTAHIPAARNWHFVTTGYLRLRGINTPTYRKDSWEVDWSKRNGKLVWARNLESKMPSARNWHWVDFHTIENAGLTWKPKQEKEGRYIDSNGYINLTPRGMTTEDIELADRLGLWSGKRRSRCLEHRLIATKKFGRIPPGMVVRHVNGCKTDNSFDNLVLGTTQENTADHETARLLTMYWHNRTNELLRELGRPEE